MLNRMVELATQSANGAYDNTTDRYQLQKEVEQLKSEINRIADSANFNGIKLLDGSMDAGGRVANTTAQINDMVISDNVKGLDANNNSIATGSGGLNLTGDKLNFKMTDKGYNAAAAVAAINYVSDIRGTLGATQNRLDHTINNLSVMTEDIQDAESTIRDTDVAAEMMKYTKNNILIRSAQANRVPQGVLQLLQ